MDQRSAARRTVLALGEDETQVLSVAQWVRLEGCKSARRVAAPSPLELWAIAKALKVRVEEVLRVVGYLREGEEEGVVAEPEFRSESRSTSP